MVLDYDLQPTDPIGVPHLVGTVDRRFLITYPLSPDSLEPYLPPGSELETFAGKAWVSVCAVRISGLRPSWWPKPFGIHAQYVIYRTVATLPFPDRKSRRSVLILEANLNTRLATILAGKVTGIAPRRRPIQLEQDHQAWRVELKEHDGTTRYAAEIPREGISAALPAGSAFPSSAAASHFILEMSYGGEWLRERGAIRLLAETHAASGLEFGSCTTKVNTVVERLAGRSVEADHVLVMTNVPHQFALRGTLSSTAGLQ